MAYKKVIINGVTYETNEVNAPLADNPSEVAKFVETSDGNLIANKMVAGMVGYSDGNLVTGTAEDNGAISGTLDVNSLEVTIPEGFTSGGKISITPETKSVTPTKTAQDITPTSGKVLSKVTVGKIPEAYQDVTGTTATATDVTKGKIIVGADGKTVTGTHTDPTFTLANGVLSIR